MQYCQSQNQAIKEADPELTIVKFPRAFCGFFELEHLGQIYQKDTQVPQLAGEDSNSGKSKTSGLKHGELSS